MPDEQPAQAPDQAVILPASPLPSDQTQPTPEPKQEQDQAPAPVAPPGLIYLGGQAIVGIPARDIEARELSGLELTVGELVATGLYQLRSEI